MTLKYCVATDSDWSINLFNKSNYVAFVISPLLLSLRVVYNVGLFSLYLFYC